MLQLRGVLQQCPIGGLCLLDPHHRPVAFDHLDLCKKKKRSASGRTSSVGIPVGDGPQWSVCRFFTYPDTTGLHGVGLTGGQRGLTDHEPAKEGGIRRVFPDQCL